MTVDTMCQIEGDDLSIRIPVSTIATAAEITAGSLAYRPEAIRAPLQDQLAPRHSLKVDSIALECQHTCRAYFGIILGNRRASHLRSAAWDLSAAHRRASVRSIGEFGMRIWRSTAACVLLCVAQWCGNPVAAEQSSQCPAGRLLLTGSSTMAPLVSEIAPRVRMVVAPIESRTRGRR